MPTRCRAATIGFVLAMLLCAFLPKASAQSNAKPERIKNVILLIGDGCGLGHILVADYYEHGEKGRQEFEMEFRQLAASTYPDGSGYDPQAAWADFQYVKQGVTDSAAAATALATGRKTRNGMIGVDPDKNPLENVVEKAEKRGKATGVVTSVQFSHATPAAFGAHNPRRSNYAEIAQEMLLKSGLDVIMGACHPWYDDAGQPTATVSSSGLPEGIPEEKYRFVGGSELWSQLRAGTAGNDCDGDGQADPWTLVQSRDEFRKLVEGDTPKRVIGVAQVADTLQLDRASLTGNPNEEEPGQSPRLETVPTLGEMAQGALNILDNDPDGFFLMVEGGAIDWASGKQLGRTIEETMDLFAAIEAVVAWVTTRSNWQETLVVVTADHETGYPNGPDSDPEWKPIQNNGKGKMPGIKWCGGHTRSLVPLFVKGAGAELFEKAAVHDDPKRGKYLDNTDIGRIIGDLVSK